MDIEQQNRLLSVEYPRIGPLAWIRSDDKRLFFPHLVENDNQTLVFDYVANPHTGLIEVRPVVELAPLLPRFQGGETDQPIWVLCHCQFLSEDAWKMVYGTVHNYQPKQWLPTYTSHHDVVPLHLTEEPTESRTWDMIHFLRSTTIPRPGEFSYEYKRAQDQKTRVRREENKYALKHTMGALGRLPHQSGTRSSGVSYPSTSTTKQ